MPAGFVILGNQLFAPIELAAYGDRMFFMAEDIGLCTFVRHHKQKLVLFLAAMRAYRDELRTAGLRVDYHELDPAQADPGGSYEAQLTAWIHHHGITQLTLWEIEDKFFEARIEALALRLHIGLEFLPSPMFLTSRTDFHEWLSGHRPLMADFYRWQRERLGVLLAPDGRPRGGQWSFDADNRKPLPARVSIPLLQIAPVTAHVEQLIDPINQRFADHPGRLDRSAWWLPTTREQALSWLDDFLEHRLASFGPYEDALSQRDPFLFHSVLTPALNLGLLTPAEVLERALECASDREVPLASIEGFVRQIIGWREFIRGMYREHSVRQQTGNFFGHRRTLNACWYAGTTGLPPLDDVIAKAIRWGWTHHIERLMVLGNLMTLCEVEPDQAYRFFMEMFVDSSDWVMVPNVYGMGLFADGGTFATKPYLCGSNYILKMSDYRKPPASDGPGWCDIFDGLYWRFIDRHRTFFGSQPRLQRSIGLLDRLDATRRRRIFAAADAFIERTTSEPV